MSAPTLHTLNKPAAELARVCLAALRAGDSLLLLEDGVHMALMAAEALAAAPADVRLFVLSEDLAARGISARIRPCFSQVGYVEFVGLCLAHARVVNWN